MCGLTTSVSVVAPTTLSASTNVTTKVKLPRTVGVPDSTPVGERTNPGGREPLSTDQSTYAAEPPTPVSCSMYAVPTVACGRFGGLTFTGETIDTCPTKNWTSAKASDVAPLVPAVSFVTLPG